MGSALVGVASLTKQLEALGKLEDGKALRDSARAGLKPTFTRAQATIPVGTVEHRTYKGRLVAPGFGKRSLRLLVSMSKDKTKATAILGVRAEAFYEVVFVELGTSKMAAQPWFRSAFYSTRPQQEEGIAKSLQKSIDKAAKTK